MSAQAFTNSYVVDGDESIEEMHLPAAVGYRCLASDVSVLKVVVVQPKLIRFLPANLAYFRART